MQITRARHDYHIYEQFEAGLVLQGWSQSTASKRTNQREVILRREAWLVHAHISPLTTSTHHDIDPLHQSALARNSSTLQQAVSRKGFTTVALSLYWSKQWVKLKIALAKGKKQHDKRQADKEKTWKRNQDRVLKNQ